MPYFGTGNLIVGIYTDVDYLAGYGTAYFSIRNNLSTMSSTYVTKFYIDILDEYLDKRMQEFPVHISYTAGVYSKTALGGGLYLHTWVIETSDYLGATFQRVCEVTVVGTPGTIKYLLKGCYLLEGTEESPTRKRSGYIKAPLVSTSNNSVITSHYARYTKAGKYHWRVPTLDSDSVGSKDVSVIRSFVLVGGGGGGASIPLSYQTGSHSGGGGGGGQVVFGIYNTGVMIPGTSDPGPPLWTYGHDFTITVGAGGSTTLTTDTASDGEPSSLYAVDPAGVRASAYYVAYGGGGGTFTRGGNGGGSTIGSSSGTNGGGAAGYAGNSTQAGGGGSGSGGAQRGNGVDSFIAGNAATNPDGTGANGINSQSANGFVGPPPGNTIYGYFGNNEFTFDAGGTDTALNPYFGAGGGGGGNAYVDMVGGLVLWQGSNGGLRGAGRGSGITPTVAGEEGVDGTGGGGGGASPVGGYGGQGGSGVFWMFWDTDNTTLAEHLFTPNATFITQPPMLVEGSKGTFLIYSNAFDGTTLQWDVSFYDNSSASDFATISGTITVNNHYSSFYVQTVNVGRNDYRSFIVRIKVPGTPDTYYLAETYEIEIRGDNGLNSAGPISLAGPERGQSIALELCRSATGKISLNDTDVRILGNKTSAGQIIIMPIDFWGRTRQIGGEAFFYVLNQESMTSGITSWTVPSGVTSISVLSVGGGAGGSWITCVSGGSGGGGAVSYANNIPVTPGQTITLRAAPGGYSLLSRGKCEASYTIQYCVTSGGPIYGTPINGDGTRCAGGGDSYVKINGVYYAYAMGGLFWNSFAGVGVSSGVYSNTPIYCAIGQGYIVKRLTGIIVNCGSYSGGQGAYSFSTYMPGGGGGASIFGTGGRGAYSTSFTEGRVGGNGAAAGGKTNLFNFSISSFPGTFKTARAGGGGGGAGIMLQTYATGTAPSGGGSGGESALSLGGGLWGGGGGGINFVYAWWRGANYWAPQGCSSEWTRGGRGFVKIIWPGSRTFASGGFSATPTAARGLSCYCSAKYPITTYAL